MIRMASGIEKSTATGEEVNTMRINYGATDRKRMVKAIGEALDEKPVYQGIPSYAYQIAEFTVTRDGNLEFPDDTDTEITSDPATLEDRRIGVLNGAAVSLLQDFLNSHSVYAEVVTYEDYDALRKDFKDHEIDVLAVEGNGAYGQKHAQIIAVFGTSDYFLCVSPDRTDLLSSARNMPRKALKTGRLRRRKRSG